MKTGNRISGAVRALSISTAATLAEQDATFTLNPSAGHAVVWRSANNSTNAVTVVSNGVSYAFSLPVGVGTTARLRQLQLTNCDSVRVQASAGGDIILLQVPDLFTSAPNAAEMNYRFEAGQLIENELGTVLEAS